MRIFVLSCILCVVINAVSLEPLSRVAREWGQYKDQFSKQYQDKDEELVRLETFASNRDLVTMQNELHSAGKATYTLALNEFADMPLHEFISTMTGLKPNAALVRLSDPYEAVKYLKANNPVTNLDSVDWRAVGAVTDIKNQHKCGSCWAFCATGNIESLLFLKTGKLISLSEQSLMDCSAGYDTYGCEGGLMDNAYLYIRDNNGIATEESYQYEAKNMSCRYNPSKRGARVKGFIDLPEGDEEILKVAVATIGPIGVGINADVESFQLYKGGVYNDPACTSDKLNHAVLAVGYGTTDQGQDYWLLKNSWGTNWGINGYMMMARNLNNLCAVSSLASFPIV